VRIAVNALDIHGDVQPWIALGRDLKRADQEVRLVTHAIFRPLVIRQGLTPNSLDPDPREVLL
jgi:UDP:flavonoid glycosyltransferase YjiC (YdhE family)